MTPPGWHPDPYRRHELRWWDGAAWSEHVSDQGRTGVDPAGAVPVTDAGAGWLPPTIQQPTVPPTPAWVPGSTPPTLSQPTIQQPTVATPAGGPRRPSALPWVIGGVVVALLVGGGALFALRGGSGDEPGSATTVPMLTTVAPPTSGPLVLPTTSSPPTTTEPSPTTAPDTTAPAGTPATGDVLSAALPTPDEVPPAWVATGAGTAVDFEGGSGPGQGLCAGDGETARAWRLGSVGNAFSDYYELPSTGQVSYWLVGFPDSGSASAYLAATAEQAGTCAETITYDLDEGAEPGQYDGFADGLGDDAVWAFDETAASAPSAVDGADESLELGVVIGYATVSEGVDYGGSYAALRLFERYGNVVLVTEVFGEWDLRGFADTDLPDYQPDAEDLVAAADVIRPIVLDRLRAAGVIG
jgi:hypothetical protein